jgi:hypothetical protein
VFLKWTDFNDLPNVQGAVEQAEVVFKVVDTKCYEPFWPLPTVYLLKVSKSWKKIELSILPKNELNTRKNYPESSFVFWKNW